MNIIKMFILFSVLVIRVELFCQSKYTNLTSGIIYKSSIGGGITITNRTGPDIVKARSAYNYDLGLYIGYRLPELKSEINYSLSFGMEKYLKYFYYDLNELRKTYFFDPSTFDMENCFGIKGGPVLKMDLNYIQRVKTFKNERYVSFLLGLGIISPVGERDSYYLWYFEIENDKTHYFQKPILLFEYYHNYPFRKYYSSYNIGLSYTYSLWKNKKLSFQLVYNYVDALYYSGRFETVSNSPFYYYSEFYHNPSNVYFNLLFSFN